MRSLSFICDLIKCSFHSNDNIENAIKGQLSYPDIGCWVTTILTCIICIDCAAQNGDIRLNDLGVYDTEDGVLEIYLENKWIPVCYKEFNLFAAATACC